MTIHEPERLQQGDRAVPFTARTFDGKQVALTDFANKKLWLCFYRYHGCPICKLHVIEVSRRYQELEKRGLAVVAIFDSPRLKLGQEGREAFPRFPLLSDPDRALYAAYGVESRLSGLLHPSVIAAWFRAHTCGYRQGKVDGKFTSVPAHFLIRADGTIHHAHYNEHLVDHISWERVESFSAEGAAAQ